MQAVSLLNSILKFCTRIYCSFLQTNEGLYNWFDTDFFETWSHLPHEFITMTIKPLLRSHSIVYE